MPGPIRFLQLTNFYPAYVRDFYAARAGRAQASFRDQMNEMLDEGFSGPHMMTREMERRGWETMMIVANAAPAQEAWLRENEISYSALVDGAAVAAMQIQMFRPDVLYTLDPISFDSRFLRRIPTRPALTAGWRGFPIPEGTDWRDMDLIFTSFDAIAAAAPLFGARGVRRHYPGFPMTDAVPEPADYDCDVLFSGSITRHHRNRIVALYEIWRASQGSGGAPFSFHLHMPDVSFMPAEMRGINRPSLWGKAMMQGFARAKIVVNIDLDSFAAQPPNMRLIEATGAGAFLLTTHHPDLPRFFAPGQEIETFRDIPELLAKIRHYLTDDQTRRAIARAGRTRCQAHHTLAQTAGPFHDMITTALDRPAAASR